MNLRPLFINLTKLSMPKKKAKIIGSFQWACGSVQVREKDSSN